MNELTITDVKELVKGKKVNVSSAGNNSTSIFMTDAIVITEPDSGIDGKIVILKPDMGCKIELDCNDMIEAIHGNENFITVTFSNGMSNLDIIITGDVGTEADHVINQDELCQYIKDRLNRLSKLTVEDIDLILNMEMEYLQSRGIVD